MPQSPKLASESVPLTPPGYVTVTVPVSLYEAWQRAYYSERAGSVYEVEQEDPEPAPIIEEATPQTALRVIPTGLPRDGFGGN